MGSWQVKVMVTQRNLTIRQKILLGHIYSEVKEMETSNDLQYALKGMLTEISHLATDEYFDPNYVAEKARIIFLVIKEK